MHSHNFLFLPENYCKKTLELLKKQGHKASPSTVRSVKSGHRNNNKVLLALLEIEAENIQLLKKIQHKIKKNNNH